MTIDSSLNLYLNNEYIDIISDFSHIVNHDFCVGGVGKEETSITSHLENEKKVVWHSKVDLISVTDFLIVSLNTE